MKRGDAIGSVFAVVALAIAASGCTKEEPVPQAWRDVVPIEGGQVVEADTDTTHITVAYEAGVSSESIREKLRARLEKKGLERGYECAYSDKRLADGYLKKPDAYEYTLIPEENGQTMLMMSHHTDVDAFDTPDPVACKMLR